MVTMSVYTKYTPDCVGFFLRSQTNYQSCSICLKYYLKGTSLQKKSAYSTIGKGLIDSFNFCPCTFRYENQSNHYRYLNELTMSLQGLLKYILNKFNGSNHLCGIGSHTIWCTLYRYTKWCIHSFFVLSYELSTHRFSTTPSVPI